MTRFQGDPDLVWATSMCLGDKKKKREKKRGVLFLWNALRVDDGQLASESTNVSQLKNKTPRRIGKGESLSMTVPGMREPFQIPTRIFFLSALVVQLSASSSSQKLHCQNGGIQLR